MMEYVLFKQISNINMDRSPTSSTFNEVKRDYQHLMRNRMEKYRETLGLLQYRLGKKWSIKNKYKKRNGICGLQQSLEGIKMMTY